jgi:CBS domain-containing protein
MTRRVQSISPDATLREAAQAMHSLEVGSLPVCRSDDTKPVGVITDRDITVRAVSEGRDPEVARVEDVMTPDIVFCHDDEDIESAVKLMEVRQIRRLPVMNQADKLIGMVSLGDLATRQADMEISGEVLQCVSLAPNPVASGHKPLPEVDHELPNYPT